MPFRTPPRLAPALAGAVLAGAIFAGAVFAATAQAQAPAPTPARRAAAQTASVNLLALPFGVASAEYERAVGLGFAVGVGGLATLDPLDENDGDDRYGGNYDARAGTLQLKLKYYPREEGLRGFAVGITAGVVAASDRRRSFVFDPATQTGVPGAVVRRSVTAPTLGAVLDYNFLLGRRRRFLLGLGVGARRVLNGGRDGLVEATLPDGRLQIGVGF